MSKNQKNLLLKKIHNASIRKNSDIVSGAIKRELCDNEDKIEKENRAIESSSNKHEDFRYITPNEKKNLELFMILKPQVKKKFPSKHMLMKLYDKPWKKVEISAHY